MQSYQRFQHIVHTVFNTSGTNGPCSLSWAKAGTHATPALSRAHSGLHGETGGVLGGGGITTLGAFHTVRKPCVAGCQNGVLCRFGILAGRCSRRTQKAFGTAMRLCVSLFRRRRSPAGLRCSVCNLVMLLFFHSARRAFHTCKRGCGITTLGVLRVLSKRWAAACQNSSFAVF